MDMDTEIVRKGSIDATATTQKLRNVLSRRQHCPIPNGMMKATSIPLRAGQATLHHFYTVHASGPNMAPHYEPRVGLAVRYMSANVRKQQQQQQSPVKEMITFISGRADLVPDTGFDDEWEPILPERPTPQEIDRGKAVHAIAMQRETTNYFSQSEKCEIQD